MSTGISGLVYGVIKVGSDEVVAVVAVGRVVDVVDEVVRLVVVDEVPDSEVVDPEELVVDPEERVVVGREVVERVVVVVGAVVVVVVASWPGGTVPMEGPVRTSL